MFSDSGKAMKWVATFIFILGCIGSVFLAIGSSAFYSLMYSIFGIRIPVVFNFLFVFLIGCFASYLAALMLALFGELVESITEIAKNTRELQRMGEAAYSIKKNISSKE